MYVNYTDLWSHACTIKLIQHYNKVKEGDNIICTYAVCMQLYSYTYNVINNAILYYPCKCFALTESSIAYFVHTMHIHYINFIILHMIDAYMYFYNHIRRYVYDTDQIVIIHNCMEVRSNNL